jgi:hypothetical protein
LSARPKRQLSQSPGSAMAFSVRHRLVILTNWHIFLSTAGVGRRCGCCNTVRAIRVELAHPPSADQFPSPPFHWTWASRRSRAKSLPASGGPGRNPPIPLICSGLRNHPTPSSRTGVTPAKRGRVLPRIGQARTQTRTRNFLNCLPPLFAPAGKMVEDHQPAPQR